MNKEKILETMSGAIACILLVTCFAFPGDRLHTDAQRININNVSRNSSSGNNASRNSASCNSTSRNSISRNSTSRNSTSRNSTSGNSTNRNNEDGNSSNGNSTRDNNTSRNSGNNSGSSSRPATVNRQERPTVNVADFTDISSNAYYYDAVKWAVENKITVGTSKTTFSPNQVCKRSEIITFLYRLAGSPYVENENLPFKDVPENASYRSALIWAYQKHITSGTSGDTFSPTDECTRGQIVTLLYRMQSSPQESHDDHFTDVSNNTFYYDAVNWAYSNAITSGTGKTTFSPNESCLRCQTVTFLYRLEQTD